MKFAFSEEKRVKISPCTEINNTATESEEMVAHNPWPCRKKQQLFPFGCGFSHFYQKEHESRVRWGQTSQILAVSRAHTQ
jgi:hypothetical protein